MTDAPQQAPSSVAYTPSPAPAPQQPVDISSLLSELESWKGRYNGQQGAMQKAVEEKRSALEKLAELNQSLESTKTEYEARLKEMESRYKTIEQQALERQNALQKYERQREMRSFISANYPDLVAPYDEGLVVADNLEGDALKAHLDKFAAFFRSTKTDAVVKAVSGGVPPAPPPASTASASSQEISDRLMRMNPNSPEYRKLYTEWIAAVDQERKK